jgi:hypothetical protein
MSSKMSLGTAIGLDAGLAYALVVVAVLALPETRGKNLEEDLPAEARESGEPVGAGH